MDIVPNVLLQGVGKEWSVYEEDIANLTITDGEFDLGNVHPTEREALEKFFSQVEDRYPSVVRTIRNGQSVSYTHLTLPTSDLV